jgi:hypothetical protein
VKTMAHFVANRCHTPRPRILIRLYLDHLSEPVSSRPCSVRPLVPFRTLEAVPKRALIISFA